MNTKAQEWAESYFSRLENAIETLRDHDLVSQVNFIKYPGATDEQIAAAETIVYEKQKENSEDYDAQEPEEPFVFNPYMAEFYKRSNGLHVSWHSVIFPEAEALESDGEIPVAKDDDDFKEGWISILPSEALASQMGFYLYGDPQETELGEYYTENGALFNYFDAFNYYHDSCMVLENGNPTIAFGDDHSASYDTPHECDFVIYMEYALSTFFSVECRSQELYFSDTNTVHPELEKMVATQDYSNLLALLKDNEHTDIDAVIALGYEEKGNQYVQEEHMENLPEAIKERLTLLIE
ncbi:hypothetical protein [Flavobacterium cerinum]|uniref:YubB ferredoxin-like domain-containing protein n=1 Tax=Flavobacterium cerinum TaxID=2502784 RepID=A0ABY5ITP5_9FLAO|nr:hypothetical protein [Flavobacterium cerinum]UUC44897.1 hypothetical protein NOX80_14855 [Flavobacterium cerinum]